MIRSRSRTQLALVAPLAAASFAAQGATTYFTYDGDANTPSTSAGLIVPSVAGGFGVGEGRNGTNALRLWTQFFSEAFFDINGGAAITGADGAGIVHVQYYYNILSAADSNANTTPSDGQFYTIATYNNGARGAPAGPAGQYRAYSTSNLTRLDTGTPQVRVDLRTRPQVNIGTHITNQNLPVSTWQRVDWYLNLNELIGNTTIQETQPNDPTLPGPSPAGRIYQRVLTEDATALLGVSRAGNGETQAPGQGFTERQIAAIQFFDNGGSLDVLLDDITLNVLDVSDLDSALRAIDNAVAYAADLDWNNDAAVDFTDSLHYIGAVFGTSPGDLNLDEIVDSVDRGLLVSNLGLNNAGWSDGDVNGDEIVDAADLALLDQYLIPEPAVTTLLALGAASMIGRRRRA